MFWVLGALAASKMQRSFRILAGYAGTLALLLIFCIWAAGKEVWQDTAVAILAVASLFVARNLTGRGWMVPERPARFLAGGAAISYSLYLFHAPVMNTVRTVLEAGYGIHLATRNIDSFSLGFFIGFVVIAIAAGYSAWFLFEKHTGVVRAMLKQRFEVQPA